MPSTLKNVVQFTGLAVGVPASLAHQLNIEGRAVTPDLAIPEQVGGYTVTVDSANVTVTRLAGSPSAVDVYVEYWHSVERAFPSRTNTLSGTPFIASGAATSGGGIADSVNIMDYGAVPNDSSPAVAAQNRAAIQDALADAASLGLDVYVPPYTFWLDQTPGQGYSILMSALENLRLWGIAGQSRLKHIDNVAPTIPVDIVRRVGCTNTEIYGIVFDGNWGNVVTEIAAGSDLATLPQATIDVLSTEGLTAPGSVSIVTESGTSTVTFTSLTSTQLLGCAGGSGLMHKGDLVGLYNTNAPGNGNQTYQADPRNMGVRDYGTDGVNLLPNNNNRITRCQFVDLYGDAIWHAYSYGHTIADTTIAVTARHGITFSNDATDIEIRRVTAEYTVGEVFDCEPVEGPVRNIRMIDTTARCWFDPRASNCGALSIAGGVVTRPAPWNYASGWRLTNCELIGVTIISDAVDVHFTDCLFDTLSLYVETILATIHMSEECDDIWLTACQVYGGNGNDSENSYGAITILPYRYGTHAAGSPGNVYINDCSVHARDGMAPVWIGAAGGWPGVTGTATTYTPPSGPATPGTLTFSGTPFSGQVDYFIGHRVLVAGVLANIVANTANTLSLAPVAENYTGGLAWYNSLGQTMPDPSFAVPVAATVLPTGGWIHVNGGTFDCGGTDSYAPGGSGIVFDTSATWDFGYTDVKIAIDRPTILNAVGPAIRSTVSGGVGGDQFVVTNPRICNTLPTNPTTYGILFQGAEGWTSVTCYGVDLVNMTGITAVSGLTARDYWIAGSTTPPMYAGTISPAGTVSAPMGAQFVRVDTGDMYIKTVDGGTTGWKTVQVV